MRQPLVTGPWAGCIRWMVSGPILATMSQILPGHETDLCARSASVIKAASI